jgi:hypothetical protein
MQHDGTIVLVEPLLVKVDEAERILSLSRSTISQSLRNAPGRIGCPGVGCRETRGER